MRSLGHRLGEVQIRERLDLVDRWLESGLSMTAWAQGQGLDAGALMGAVAYEGRWPAKLNGHDARAYLKDILTKLPTRPNGRLAELLPHRWVAPGKD